MGTPTHKPYIGNYGEQLASGLEAKARLSQAPDEGKEVLGEAGIIRLAQWCETRRNFYLGQAEKRRYDLDRRLLLRRLALEMKIVLERIDLISEDG